MGDRIASAKTFGRHAGAALGVAADGALNGAAILLGPSVNQGEIGFVDFATAELFSKALVGFVILGDDHQSAGGAIEAVDDAWAEVASDGG